MVCSSGSPRARSERSLPTGVRYVTNRSVLAEAGDSIKRFIDSGVLELGDRLGPLLWQMNPYKKFDEADFGKFLELLPPKVGDQSIRHVVEVRHDSFKTPAFIARFADGHEHYHYEDGA